MIPCLRCNSLRVATVSAKCSDAFNLSLEGRDYEGYVPTDLGIGGDDYVEFDYCMDCGQIQGSFPLMLTELELEED